MGEFIDNAAIAAMAAIISNEKLMTQCMDEASLQKIKLADRVAIMAYDYADAMAAEHKKRFNKTAKVL